MKSDGMTPSIIQHDRWQGFELKKLILHHAEGQVPALFLQPKGNVGPHPCVIAVHGFTSSKDEWLELDEYTKGGNVVRDLLRGGYAVIAVDMYYHGENGVNPDLSYDEVFNEYWAVFFEETMKGILCVIDYVDSQEALDSERIGFLSYSLGGVFAFKVANSTDRIKAVATCVPPVFKDDDDEYAPYNNVDNLADIPFLMISASQDEYNDFAEVQWLFAQLPSKGDKRLVSFESGHSLPTNYVGVVVDWFKTHL